MKQTNKFSLDTNNEGREGVVGNPVMHLLASLSASVRVFSLVSCSRVGGVAEAAWSGQ